jgi:hypothetical protein
MPVFVIGIVALSKHGSAVPTNHKIPDNTQCTKFREDGSIIGFKGWQSVK